MDSDERQKHVLHRYLVQERGALLAKAEGLDEYDLRRPLTPTGTSILGVVKHVASVQLCYLGAVFSRPSERDPLPWYRPGADLAAVLRAALRDPPSSARLRSALEAGTDLGPHSTSRSSSSAAPRSRTSSGATCSTGR